jgi:hypothetical protein
VLRIRLMYVPPSTGRIKVLDTEEESGTFLQNLDS